MFAIVSFSAMAQEGHRHGPREARESLNPEQVATLQTKKMTLALDLTQAQQEKVQQFHLENVRERQEKMNTRKEERQNTTREEPSKEERFQRESERLDRMIADKQKMKEILTDDQFEKWEGMMQHQMHRHRKGKRGKHGRP